MHRNGEQPSDSAHSPKSLPLQSPSTVAAGLGHLPLQHKLQVNVWADNSSRQVKTHRRVGGGGGRREEVICHRSGTHMNSGSLSSDGEESHVFGLRCSDGTAPEGGDIVLVIRQTLKLYQEAETAFKQPFGGKVVSGFR